MIGVRTAEEHHEIVREFFELFKTPWEFYRPGGKYDALIDCLHSPVETPSPVTLIYGALNGESREVHRANDESTVPEIDWDGRSIPIYCGCLTFPDSATSGFTLKSNGASAASVSETGGRITLQIGYNLFQEVEFLLGTGQPVRYAATPTLELHINLLRHLILSCGIGLVEIPPVPAGHPFIVCLTHDVDHPGVRFHQFDHTMCGFLYRALIGNTLRAWKKAISLRELWKSWSAAFTLPLVYLGLKGDFWDTFTTYADLEAGLGVTFFVIPHSHDAGHAQDGGPAPGLRASRYGASDIAPQIKAIIARGSEVGTHGIDAWTNSQRAIKERDEVSRVAGHPPTGVRMHWLFCDKHSSAVLESARFDYDSSFGYNETIGFRAGTTQPFKPIGARSLIELPLNVMDTALFYPSFLNMTPEAAREAVGRVIDGARQFGGVITINWHDRSVAPERLWGGFYRNLLSSLEEMSPWFPTAQGAVDWFRRRRSASFAESNRTEERVEIRITVEAGEKAPGLVARIHQPGQRSAETFFATVKPHGFKDITFAEDLWITVPLIESAAGHSVAFAAANDS